MTLNTELQDLINDSAANRTDAQDDILLGSQINGILIEGGSGNDLIHIDTMNGGTIAGDERTLVGENTRGAGTISGNIMPPGQVCADAAV